jgi:hypothetical protein
MKAPRVPCAGAPPIGSAGTARLATSSTARSSRGPGAADRRRPGAGHPGGLHRPPRRRAADDRPGRGSPPRPHPPGARPNCPAGRRRRTAGPRRVRRRPRRGRGRAGRLHAGLRARRGGLRSPVAPWMRKEGPGDDERANTTPITAPSSSTRGPPELPCWTSPANCRTRRAVRGGRGRAGRLHAGLRARRGGLRSPVAPWMRKAHREAGGSGRRAGEHHADHRPVLIHQGPARIALLDEQAVSTQDCEPAAAG